VQPKSKLRFSTILQVRATYHDWCYLAGRRSLSTALKCALMLSIRFRLLSTSVPGSCLGLTQAMQVVQAQTSSAWIVAPMMGCRSLTSRRVAFRDRPLGASSISELKSSEPTPVQGISACADATSIPRRPRSRPSAIREASLQPTAETSYLLECQSLTAGVTTASSMPCERSRSRFLGDRGNETEP
jgi:hypothetical protein